MNPLQRTLGVVAGVAALGGAAYGVQRALVQHALRQPDPEADLDLLLHADRSRLVATRDGGKIATYERGDGPPILLIHGVTLQSRVWAKQFDSLPDAGFRVVAADLRGHGESEIGEEGFTLEVLGTDVIDVIEALGLEDALVLGHSLGGIATMSAAVHHPAALRARTSGLALLSTSGRAPIPELPGLERFVQTTLAPTIARMMSFPNLGYTLARVGYGHEAHARHVDLNRRMISASSPTVIHRMLNAIAGMDLIEELKAVDLPTIVLNGTADVITPLPEARRIANAIPDSRLIEFPRAGHMLMLERADHFDAEVVGFAHELGMRPALP